ncbi:MAG: nicotinate phosphoribosyltransferase [Bacteroidetes bacterium]|nr:MAG: nicotinate phosphoribosyltransferase [Bacteroidota bacterium]
MIPGSHLSSVYRAGWGNLTDLYELTMAYGYWQQKIHERRAVFHLFFRSHPFRGNFTVAAGLALVADYLENLCFSVVEIQYLGSLRGADGQPLFPEAFLHYLQRLRFTGDLFAIPEGTLVFPHEPLLRIEAPLLQAQLVESALLTLTNFSSLIATKAARVRRAAQTDTVLEFGLRRAQGLDGALTASRAAYLGGCDATSNVWAGQHLGIPVQGTHAHSWVMVFADELEAFEHYAAALPNNCTFLVDTYDTIKGVENAISVGLRLREQGHDLLGIRLDSGDLAALSIKARQLLDDAGFQTTRIVASNDLDEFRIHEIKGQQAAINTWGIGTRLVTGHDDPALGGVYKLAALADENGQLQPRIKLSEQPIKISNPGRQQVRRFFGPADEPLGDMIFAAEEVPGEERTVAPFHRTGTQEVPAGSRWEDLLVPVFDGGVICYDFPQLEAIRANCLRQVQAFEQSSNKPYLYGLSPKLAALKTELIENHQ